MRRIEESRALVYAAIGGLLLVGGCARATRLEPAPGANEAQWLPQAAVSEVAEFEVVAQGGAWPDDRGIERHVTPVRVVLENESENPVRLQYRDIALIANDGTRYAALPPHRIDGTISEKVTLRHVEPLADPMFVHRGFLVAAYTRPIYPTLGHYGGRLTFDRSYYDHYQSYWVDYELPTPTMLRHALPEGVLEPEGRIAGYLYFEKVDPTHEQVRLRADVVAANTGKILGEVSIPFVVD